MDTEMVTVQTPECIHCHKTGEVTLPKAAWVRYQEDGEFIQTAWPEGSAGEREQIINGTHPACFEEMFPPEESEQGPSDQQVFEALEHVVEDDSPLTAAKVGILMGQCLHPDGTKTMSAEDTIFVEAIMHSYAFNRAAIEAHHEQIHEMLLQLPDEFQQRVEGEGREAGGGSSFLNMCMRADDVQWTGLHATQELLMGLGLASGWATLPLPRFMWDVLYGGMPYFAVRAERAEVTGPSEEQVAKLNEALAAQEG